MKSRKCVGSVSCASPLENTPSLVMVPTSRTSPNDPTGGPSSTYKSSRNVAASKNRRNVGKTGGTEISIKRDYADCIHPTRRGGGGSPMRSLPNYCWFSYAAAASSRCTSTFPPINRPHIFPSYRAAGACGGSTTPSCDLPPIMSPCGPQVRAFSSSTSPTLEVCCLDRLGLVRAFSRIISSFAYGIRYARFRPTEDYRGAIFFHCLFHLNFDKEHFIKQKKKKMGDFITPNLPSTAGSTTAAAVAASSSSSATLCDGCRHSSFPFYNTGNFICSECQLLRMLEELHKYISSVSLSPSSSCVPKTSAKQAFSTRRDESTGRKSGRSTKRTTNDEEDKQEKGKPPPPAPIKKKERLLKTNCSFSPHVQTDRDRVKDVVTVVPLPMSCRVEREEEDAVVECGSSSIATRPDDVLSITSELLRPVHSQSLRISLVGTDVTGHLYHLAAELYKRGLYIHEGDVMVVNGWVKLEFVLRLTYIFSRLLELCNQSQEDYFKAVSANLESLAESV